jgi:hypothetical protein
MSSYLLQQHALLLLPLRQRLEPLQRCCQPLVRLRDGAPRMRPVRRCCCRGSLRIALCVC